MQERLQNGEKEEEEAIKQLRKNMENMYGETTDGLFTIFEQSH